MLCSFIFTVRVIYFNPGVDEQTVIDAAVRFMFLNIIWIIFDIVPIVLGIVGLFQKEKKKIFSILGIVISSTTILGIIILMMVVHLLQQSKFLLYLGGGYKLLSQAFISLSAAKVMSVFSPQKKILYVQLARQMLVQIMQKVLVIMIFRQMLNLKMKHA